MAARIMSGNELAATIVEQCAQRSVTLTASLGRQPCLSALLIGDDPASETYVRMKRNRCDSAGIESRLMRLDRSVSTAEAVAAVDGLSDDPTVDGILVQHPVPHQVDERAVFEAIDPRKDVDGVSYASFAAMAFGGDGFASCTPAGILALLDHYGVDLEGSHAVVIGRSPILGKPVGMLLLERHATVTYCHSRTRDVAARVRTADVVVAAVGIAEFVRREWIKQDATVIDAGYNEGNVGDVDFDGVSEVAGLITPVPGGVGPMTIAMLMKQTVDAAELSHSGV